MKVKILAHTPEPEKVIAMAGKLCYSPSDIDTLEENLTEDSINSFVNRLVSMNHESPLEHVTFTFGIEGVSRSLTHQLVRHRLASYSQKSQRYVKEGQFEYVVPDDIKKHKDLKKIYIQQMENIQENYDELVFGLIALYIFAEDFEELINDNLKKFKIKKEEFSSFIQEQMESTDTVEDTVLKLQEKYKKLYSVLEKKAIENARYVLPNACETKIIVTMNIRSLFNFFEHRCCNRAQDEIRDLADEMLRQCREIAPVLFAKAGASCEYGKCPEGAMTCGNPRGDRN